MSKLIVLGLEGNCETNRSFQAVIALRAPGTPRPATDVDRSATSPGTALRLRLVAARVAVRVAVRVVLSATRQAKTYLPLTILP